MTTIKTENLQDDRCHKQTRMNKREQIVDKLIEIHNNKYDYSKFEYINAHHKSIIICEEHGEFMQNSNNHLQGKGCNKCAHIIRSEKRSSNCDEFILKSIDMHGDIYDYSKVEYIGVHKKVIIICKLHGEFMQEARSHLRGRGCRICGIESSNKKRSSNNDEFTTKAIKIHADTYDYSNIEYTGFDNKLNIICKLHGEFAQVASKHLEGHGCLVCGIEKRKKKQSTDAEAQIEYKNNIKNCKKYEAFVEKAIKIHGEKYNYSKFEYINAKHKSIIICSTHGEFLQHSNNHLIGYGCINCGVDLNKMKRSSNSDEFIKKAIKIHGDKYDYSKIEYISNHKKVNISCKMHGEFMQESRSHLSGSGCYLCGRELSKNKLSYSNEQFINKSIEIHGDKYDYSKIEYINTHSNINIICKTHGIFIQAPQKHICGHGCPLCVNKTEGKLYEKLKQIYPDAINGFRQPWCKNKYALPFDFCVQEDKIIIELDGDQHFKQVRNWTSPKEQFENDKYKEKCANENGYSTIRLLQQDVYDDNYDWVKELCDTIELIKISNKITNIYLCKNNEYAKF
jgi:very-short-patch-repair endonuclease